MVNTLQRPGYSIGWCTLLTTPKLLSQRAKPLTVVVRDLPERPHQTRNGKHFPGPLRESDARPGLACLPPARRGGAPHTRRCCGWGVPDFGRCCATGQGQVIHAFIHPFPLPLGVAPTNVTPAGRSSSPLSSRPRGQQSRGSGETDHSSPTGHDRHPEDRGLSPRCPTRGTLRLQAGRRFRAESIRSDSTIDASNHDREGPPKSDSKRWV